MEDLSSRRGDRKRSVPMNHTEIQESSDCEIVYIHNAIVSVLAKFLDLSVPWVWILGHRPNPCVQWWDTSIPLNVTGSTLNGSVRDICLDIQLPTCDFVSRVKEFDGHGLALIQSHQRMPDTLCLERIPDSQQNAVLIQNGSTLRMNLPHAIETAQVQSFRKGYLASRIGTEHMKA